VYRAAKAHTEDHPVPGQLLEGSDLLRRPRGMSQREDHDAETHLDPRRGGRGDGEGQRAVGQRRGRGQVITGEEAVQPGVLHLPGERAQATGI
jgi:hypothetical protein